MKLYTAFYYKPDDSFDNDYFVADETKDLEKQFIKYYLRENDTRLTLDNIDAIYEMNRTVDCSGNSYQISIERK